MGPAVFCSKSPPVTTKFMRNHVLILVKKTEFMSITPDMRISTLAWECCLFLFTGFADEYERLLEAVLSMVLETCGCATAVEHLFSPLC